jgi:hypothetical protein
METRRTANGMLVTILDRGFNTFEMKSITVDQLQKELLQKLKNDPTSVANIIETLSSYTDEGALICPRVRKCVRRSSRAGPEAGWRTESRTTWIFRSGASAVRRHPFGHRSYLR